MTLLTQDQVYDLCRDVGFKHKAARIASAIAMCESPHFDYDAKIAYSDFGAVGDLDLVDATWGPSYSGWQIRSLKADLGTGRWRDADQLVHPRFAARAARHIQKTQGWDAWTMYTNGAYKAYLQAEFPPAPGTYVVVSGDNGLSVIAAKFDNQWPWEEWARVNNLHAPYLLRLGDVLTIPTGGQS